MPLCLRGESTTRVQGNSAVNLLVHSLTRWHTLVMRKRRKVLVILGLIAVAAVCFVMLKPRDEPKYQDSYLSEWLAIRYDSAPRDTKRVEADNAIRKIGTNALPYFFKAMRQELPEWKVTLRQVLPNKVKRNVTVDYWLFKENVHAIQSAEGIIVLGTNAVSALPELEVMMKERIKLRDASLAIYALGGVGEPAIPVLQRGIADPNQLFREQIIQAIEAIAYQGHTNACLPILREALNDENATVRSYATNSVRRLTLELLPSTPAQ